MIGTAPVALGHSTCRDRLAGSRRGFVACTQGALPMVIPVGLRADDGQLLLTVGAAKVSGLLVGQVVALTVGRNARRFRQGWSVTAHGRLGNTLPDGSLPLEIAHLEGVTVAHPPRRRMS